MALALACDLTGAWPSEALERSSIELTLAAELQARIYREQAEQFDV